jgi:hypothetical protein
MVYFMIALDAVSNCQPKDLRLPLTCAARRGMPSADIKFVRHTTAITARLAHSLARKSPRLWSNY